MVVMKSVVVAGMMIAAEEIIENVKSAITGINIDIKWAFNP